MQTIFLRRSAPVRAPGSAVTDADYDVLLTGDTDVFTADGSRAMSLRRNVVSAASIEAALPLLREIAKHGSDNRSTAAGLVSMPRPDKNGKPSKIMVSVDPTTGKPVVVPSAVYGYFERSARFPYCRQTSLGSDSVDPWGPLAGLLKEVTQAFASAVPERYAVQMGQVALTPPQYVIPGTPWTTISVNRNWRTYLHKDAGDLHEGFSCVVGLRTGAYTGGVLVHPKHRVGADLGNGDVLLMDAHEWHANTEIVAADDDWERITVVLYFRTKMVECGTPAEELERAKLQRGGL
jgi:hypothetical protein